MNVEQLIPAFQARLRAFAFDPELDHAATELAKRLATYRRRRADIEDRATLKALALLAEYWDAMGRAQEAAQLLRLTVEELVDDAPTWPAALAAAADPDATRRLLRQPLPAHTRPVPPHRAFLSLPVALSNHATRERKHAPRD